MLVLFYSLAIHMCLTLGGWPAGIDESGFSKSLFAHAHVPTSYFIISFLGNIVTFPIAVLLCLLIRRLRVCVYYLGMYSLAWMMCYGAMLLAPSQYLKWWQD